MPQIHISFFNKAACTIACLTIAYLEEGLYADIEIQFDTKTKDLIKQALKRYIYDVFLLWKKRY